MKKITRTLCLLLTLTFLAQPLSIAAYAEDTTIPAETVVEEIPLSTAPAEEMQNEETEPANYSHWQLKNGFENGFAPGDILCGYSGAWFYDPDAMSEEPFIYTEEREIVECRYPDVELSWEEIQLLARVIWVEARGECAEGQQAVAEVVLNRLISEKYANTLSGVIYAENQFNSVPFLDDAEPGQAQYEAIDRALYGPYILPTDVVKFANFMANENIWGKIGGHYFFYQP